MPLNKKSIYYPNSWEDGFYIGAQAALFSSYRSPKNGMFGGRFAVSHKGPKGSEDGSRSTLADFFLSNKSSPANRKKEFYASSLLKNEEIKEIFV
jgi:hypothetical protein